MTEPVVVFSSNSLVEAEMVRGLLTASGIRSMLIGGLTATAQFVIGGGPGEAQILVAGSDELRVRDVFEAYLGKCEALPLTSWRMP